MNSHLVWLCVLAIAAIGQAEEKSQMERAAELQRSASYSSAINAYDRLLQTGTQSSAIFANRARCRELLLDYQQAEKDYSKAIELAPEQTELYIFRGLCRRSAGDLRPALHDLDEAVQLQPNHALSWLIKGICLQELGKSGEASTSIRKALELDSNCPIALIRREIAKSAGTIDATAGDFFAELRGDKDPQQLQKRAEHRRWIEIMGSGYWDLDGRFKFYDDLP